MYILEVKLYYLLELSSAHSIYVHVHNTCRRCDFHGQEHNLAAFENLSSEAAVRCMNKLLKSKYPIEATI